MYFTQKALLGSCGAGYEDAAAGGALLLLLVVGRATLDIMSVVETELLSMYADDNAWAVDVDVDVVGVVDVCSGEYCGCCGCNCEGDPSFLLLFLAPFFRIIMTMTVMIAATRARAPTTIPTTNNIMLLLVCQRSFYSSAQKFLTTVMRDGLPMFLEQIVQMLNQHQQLDK